MGTLRRSMPSNRSYAGEFELSLIASTSDRDDQHEPQDNSFLSLKLLVLDAVWVNGIPWAYTQRTLRATP